MLSVNQDAKTIKGLTRGYQTGILYLAPSNLSGRVNTCPHASKGCRDACLYTAGRGGFNNVQEARIKKTVAFAENPKGFRERLQDSIDRESRKAERKGLIFTVRLNGTSDVAWEQNGIIADFPSIQFYDYTKSAARMRSFLNGQMPDNYHLTFSRSENNHRACLDTLNRGGNVAAVVTDPESAINNGLKWGPKTWKCVNGDQNDLRFLDPSPVVVVLKPKGLARHDRTGFVQHNN